MPIDCLSSVLKSVDAHMPYELIHLNAVVYNKINGLESTAYANYLRLDVDLCETGHQSEMCLKQYENISTKLGHLHLLSSSLLRKTAEHYLQQIDVLKKEVEELKKDKCQ